MFYNYAEKYIKRDEKIMHFYDVIKELARKKDVILFVDMDGVIAAYSIADNPYDYLHKRPLRQSISNIEKVSTIGNVELHILSICREISQIEDKNVWLDENAPFFKKENRHIISRAANDWKKSKDLKVEFIKNVKTDKQIAILDDDNEILKMMKDNFKDIALYQDSELVD